MGSLKALSLAGALSFATISFAQAADLLPPPPPVEAPLRGPMNDDTGLYLRVDAGIGSNNIDNWRSELESGTQLSDPTILGVHRGGDMGDSGILGGGFGYKINNWFRVDMTGEYRSHAHYHNLVTYTGSSCSGVANGDHYCSDVYSGSVRGALILFNGYFDLGTWYGLTPYIGGGVGFAHYGLHGVRDYSPTQAGAYGYASNRNDTNFAWDATAGFSYYLTRNMLFDINYRHVDMGHVKTDYINCSSSCDREKQRFRWQSDDVRVGLRWMLQPPEPVAIPIQAKY